MKKISTKPWWIAGVVTALLGIGWTIVIASLARPAVEASFADPTSADSGDNAVGQQRPSQFRIEFVLAGVILMLVGATAMVAVAEGAPPITDKSDKVVLCCLSALFWMASIVCMVMAIR